MFFAIGSRLLDDYKDKSGPDKWISNESHLFKFLLILLVIQVEEDHAVVGDRLAVVAVLVESAVLLTAQLAPVVNDPVISAAHIFLEAPVVHAGHLAVGLSRLHQQAVDYLADALISCRIA